MSKNSKNAIVEYVLCDVFNWKTEEKSYEDICKRFGDDVISKEDNNLIFNFYIKEANNLAKAQTNINEVIFNESMLIRYRALQLAIRKKPVENPYKVLSSLMKDVDYQEFEFWYYRFYHGERDFDYDRSKYPKPPTFSDLPIDVIEKIVEKSETKSRYILRRVSRDLQCLVDISKHHIEEITIIANIDHISVDVGGVKKKLSIYSCAQLTDQKTAFQKMVNSHLAIFIRNPKLQIGSLDIHLLQGFELNKILFELFKSLSHQLHVNHLIMDADRQNLRETISCMKPKVLKKLEIQCRYTGIPYIQNITDSEQWKQAEDITIDYPNFCNITHFFHFKSFDICLKEVSMESILELRNGISNSSNFEWCRITVRGGPTDIEIQRSLELERYIHNEMEYFVYNIPNSTETLVFSFSMRRLLICEFFIKKSNCFADF